MGMLPTPDLEAWNEGTLAWFESCGLSTLVGDLRRLRTNLGPGDDKFDIYGGEERDAND